MKKIVFINPSVDKTLNLKIWDSPLVRLLKGGNNVLMPKLAAMVLANITPDNYTFTYIDEDIEDVDYNIEADLVAITCMTMQANRAYRIAGEFRKRNIPVIMGGIHATVMTDEVAHHSDSLLIGEAENVWPEILKDFENGNLKKIYNSKDYPPVTELISPKIDVVNHNEYLTYPIQATRGCPYRCDFCSIHHSAGKVYKMKPVEQVVKEIQEYEKINKGMKYNLIKKSYYFIDDNLYVNRDYVIELFKALIPLKIEWHGQGTVNLSKDDEVIKLMAESGCKSISIGFESVSQKSLKESNKPIHNVVKEYSEAIHNIQKYGIIAGGNFIFGFDSDDVTIFRETVNFISEVKLMRSFINVLTPYPGTKLGDRIDEEKRIFTKSWEFYNGWIPVITPKSMSIDQLQAGASWAAREVCDFKLARRSLKNFWKLGPWERNPRLSKLERTILIFLGTKLFFHGFRKYASFLYWSAFHKDAVDLSNIIWMMMRDEFVSNLPAISPSKALDDVSKE